MIIYFLGVALGRSEKKNQVLRVERAKLPQPLQELLNNWQMAVNRGEISRVERQNLPPRLQKLLSSWQAAIDENQSVPDLPWKIFQELEKPQAKELLEVLRRMFHNKCAYCETLDASRIDHYWPKSPHPTLNANLGTPARMFVWDNLLLSCQTCNSIEYKGAHMKWDDGKPRLLNPCVDDPLCFLEVNLDYESELNGGRIDPHPNLSDKNYERAEYTIRKLGLNKRQGLFKGRVQTVWQFLMFLEGLIEIGPDHELLPGYSVRKGLLDVLQPSQSYLAAIRQILHNAPDIKAELLEKIPELAEVIDQWALSLGNCD